MATFFDNVEKRLSNYPRFSVQMIRIIENGSRFVSSVFKDIEEAAEEKRRGLEERLRETPAEETQAAAASAKNGKHSNTASRREKPQSSSEP